MREKRFCPICKASNSKLIMPIDLRTFDGVHLPLRVQISECLACGFVFNDCATDEQSLLQFYTRDNFYYTENSFGTGGNDLNRYESYRAFLMPYLYDESIIVDVGCGKAQFVKYLIDRGFKKARGVELGKRMVETARQQGIPVHIGSASNLLFDIHSIDLMVYTHVFEHLWDLDNVIEQAKKCLKHNGLLFIEVPDAAQYSNARVFDFFWLSMAEHINHFSDYYLELLLRRHGFEKITALETITPYNNPVYGYPSLKMLFRKNENKKWSPSELQYSDSLKNKIQSYMSHENEFVTKHRYIVNELKNSKTDVFVWGIGIEFFIISTFTNLLKCHIMALIDINSDKQKMTINRIKIISPEYLKQAKPDSVVLLTSVFNKSQMRDYLHEISFKGLVVVID